MKRFSHLAARSPLLFCLGITLLVFLIALAAGVAAYPANGVGASAMANGLVTLVGVIILVVLLRQLGWLDGAGVSRAGTGRAWLLLLPLIIYGPIAGVLAFFPDLNLTLPEFGAIGALGFRHLVGGGLLEEIAFRGLILYALVRVWGQTRRGLLGAVAVSALFFSLAHLINLLTGQAPAMVLLQVADTLLAGCYLAVFALYARTIWPGVLIHAGQNIAVNVLAIAHPGFEETFASWILFMGLHVPFYLLALYLLRYLPLQPALAPPEAGAPAPGRIVVG